MAGGLVVVGRPCGADRVQGGDELDLHRQPAIARRRLGVTVDELLDDAVFQRVEADHRQPTAGLEPCQRGVEAGLEIGQLAVDERSEEHTSELQSLMRISYAVFCLKKKTNKSKIIALTE